MRKRTYYLFKEILPNFLLSILFILLFDVLNYKVEVVKSIYVLYFALLFTGLNYIMSNIINLIQVRVFKKMSITDILYNKGNRILYLFLLFKIINITITLVLFYFVGRYFSKYIVISSFFISLLIGFIIEILKIILNKVFKFDKIIMLGTNQKEINKEVDNLLDEIIKYEDDNLNEEDKKKKISNDLEKIIKKINSPKENDDQEDQ